MPPIYYINVSGFTVKDLRDSNPISNQRHSCLHFEKLVQWWGFALEDFSYILWQWPWFHSMSAKSFADISGLRTSNVWAFIVSENELGVCCVCQSVVLSVAEYTHPTVTPRWTPRTVSLGHGAVTWQGTCQEKGDLLCKHRELSVYCGIFITRETITYCMFWSEVLSM